MILAICFTVFILSHIVVGQPSLVIVPSSVSFRSGDGEQQVNLVLQKGSLTSPAVVYWSYEGGTNIIEKLPNVTIPAAAAVKNKFVPIPLTIRSSGYGKVGAVTVVAVAQQAGGNISSGGSSEKNAASLQLIDLSNAFVQVSVYKADWILYVSNIVGWIYFAAWTLSFYPQLYINFRRKSVEGLSFDFLVLNLLGFSCYSAFNGALFWAAVPQAEYRARHPHSLLQVQANDVAFGLHAVAVSAATLVQCCVYERAGQRVSYPTWAFVALASAAALVQAVVCAFGGERWLDLLYYLSYVKLAITCIKYCPQVYKNYKRKSTIGWSIGNVLLDFTGGSLSLAQMFLLAFNQDDWASVLFNPTKFGLGMLSIIFDVIFIVQHYVLYNPRRMQHAPSEELSAGRYGALREEPSIAANTTESL